MHELSMVTDIVRHLEQSRKLHKFSKLISVELSCPIDDHLSDEHIQFCFEAAAKEPFIKDARLVINRRQPETGKPADDGVYITSIEVVE